MSLINEALKKAAREEAESDDSLQNAYPRKIVFIGARQASRRPVTVVLAGLVVIAGLAVAASQLPAVRQPLFALLGIGEPAQPPADRTAAPPTVAEGGQLVVKGPPPPSPPPIDRGELERQLQAGITALTHRETDKARTAFVAVLALDPSSAVAHNGLGLIEKGAGKLQEAERHYLDAIQTDPDYAEAHNNLALLYEQQGKADKAIAEYETALARRPNYPQGRLNYAIALDRAGRPAEAKREYEKFLANTPPELTDLTGKVRARVATLR